MSDLSAYGVLKLNEAGRISEQQKIQGIDAKKSPLLGKRGESHQHQHKKCKEFTCFHGFNVLVISSVFVRGGKDNFFC